MKILKQIISTFLLLALFVGMVPTNVLATDTTTSVETGQTTIEGTNSFGTLLSEDIQDQQNEDAESNSGGYNVTGLTIENGIATIEYSTLEKAMLVVALYSEDGIQLLLSSNAIVEPEGTEASIELEGEIPKYFMASAYLLDTYDYSPLCESYDTPMYTREMQELLASTTDDYDAVKILNFDDDETTNFAVYADTTIVLEYTEGVNTVVSADDETATYVIENADNNIAKLKTGDILAYAYGENQILIVKVSSINIDGKTVTINGADLEMEEVFSHVKLETTGDASDITVDESTAEEGVVYDGLSSEGSQTYSLRAVEGESGWKHYLNFKLVDKKLKDETENLDVSVSISGSLGISIDVKFSYFVSTDRQFIEFKADAGVKAAISISGKIKSKLPLPEFKLTAYGISIGFEPKLQLEFSGKVEYSFFAGFTIGISYENGKGIHDLSTSPKVESEFKLEGSIFFGIDLTPTIEVLKGAIVEAKLEAPIGFELKASLKGTLIEGSDPNADSIHACEKCVEMELNFKAEFSAKLKFLKCKWLSLETKAKAIEVKIGDMYWSVDREEFAWGKCPHISYRVTVHVKDSNNRNAVDTEVVADWAEQLTEIPMGTTNSSGVVVDYLQAGTYTFMATVDGDKLQKRVKVEESCKIVVDKNSYNYEKVFISAEEINDFTDYGAIIVSGECGANGNNAVWSLFSSGMLLISGSGDMEDYYSFTDQPWYEYQSQISMVTIKEGITSIGDFAFEFCDQLTTVSIPSSVTQINEYAFAYCNSLVEVSIPAGVKDISSKAFVCCENLKKFIVDANNLYLSSDSQGIVYNKDNSEIVLAPNGIEGSIVIPDGVTFISYEAFAYCRKITNVTIPVTVRTIEANAFEGCDNLRTVNIPENVSSIGDLPFQFCENLIKINVHSGNANYSSDEQGILYDKNKSVLLEAPGGITGNVEIPSGVQRIEFSAFESCYNLTSVSIPSTVSYIGDDAFNSCWNLSTVSIHDGVTYIGESAFYNNYNLEEIKIPAGITVINNYTFAGCSKLDNVEIPAGVTSIGRSAFRDCKLTHITIPKSVTKIEKWAFEDCVSLKKIVFEGNAPQFGDDIFDANLAWIVAEAYYPANNTTWTSNVMQDYGGAITWIPYVLDGNGEMIIDTSRARTVDVSNKVHDNLEEDEGNGDYDISMRSIWGGEYETEVTDIYTIKRASFAGLVPGEQYILLALLSTEVDEILDPNNLLYIDQQTAGEDGTLVFTYVQREASDISCVVACGASNQNLNDATITFPLMIADDDPQVVNPMVMFDENVLIEGKDYIIIGAVDYTTPGEYTCFVRGIHDYTGLVQCQYTVKTIIEIVVNEQITGKADLESSPDTFKFKPTETGVYRVHIDSPSNSLFNLRDSAGNTLVSKSGSQIVIDQAMTAGAFYLLETLFTDPSISGEFTISVEKLVPATTMEIVGDNTIIGYVGDSCNFATSFSPNNAIIETVNWTSSNNDIVEVNQSGCVMLLAPGEATITATSENGLDDSISITVKGYRELTSNVQADAIINNAGTSCYFAFTPNESGYYAFFSISDADTYGYIIDENANTLASNDDDGDGSNFKIKYLMEAGKTYILQARYYSSDQTGNFGVCIEKIKYITDLEIINMPVRSEYIKEFILDALDFTGLRLKVTWSDGSTTNWAYDGSWYIEDEYVSRDMSSTEESGNVVINCGDASVTLSLTLIDNPVDYIEIVTAPTREYIYGDREWGWLYSDGSYDFYPSDLTGLKFVVHNMDGTNKTFTSADIDNHSLIDGYYYSISFDGYDPDIGDFPVTFSYLGKSADYTVKLKESPVTSISVTKLPTATSYDSYYTPDLLGTEFAIAFTNGTTKKVVLSEENLVYEYNWDYGLIHSVVVDGNKLTIEPYYSGGGESYMAYYLDQSTEIKGFVFTENQEITGISLENVHPTGDNMNVTIMYLDGNTEQLVLDVVVYEDYYGGIEGYARTNNGLLYYSIEPKENAQGNTTGYEVYILGKTIEVEAIQITVGDANGDGVVDTLDRMVLSRYLANWDEYDVINMAAADVNGDGVVDTLDRMVLNRYLANWDGYEDLPYVG